MRERTTHRKWAARRRISRLAAFALALPTAACASIVAPGPDMVPVSSRPDGAKVTLDGVPVGRTPCTIAISRTSEGVVRIEQDGYETVVVDRDKVANGWFFLNVLWGSGMLVAFPIDLALSNQGKYSTEPIYVELPTLASTPR